MKAACACPPVQNGLSVESSEGMNCVVDEDADLPMCSLRSWDLGNNERP
ncbi:hypothetical protein [Ruminococcus albus]|nr:hypothetical protein [Ruminococcus albus]